MSISRKPEKSIWKFFEHGFDKKEIRKRGYSSLMINRVFEEWVSSTDELYDTWKMISSGEIPVDEVARRSALSHDMVYAIYRSVCDDKEAKTPHKTIKSQLYRIFNETDGSMAAAHEFAEQNGVRYHTLYTYRQSWLEDRAMGKNKGTTAEEIFKTEWDEAREKVLSLLKVYDWKSIIRPKRKTASGMVFDKYTNVYSSWMARSR